MRTPIPVPVPTRRLTRDKGWIGLRRRPCRRSGGEHNDQKQNCSRKNARAHGPSYSQLIPSLLLSNPYGSEPVTRTGPATYRGPSPDSRAQSTSNPGGVHGE